jgi:hypothetical protein
MDLLEIYIKVTTTHPFVTSFVKFGILATLGEVIAFKIRTKRMPDKSFGFLPKALVWGFLGIFIMIAFKIFALGVPKIAETLLYLSGDAQFDKILIAFYISFFMNIIFAPVMMTVHKITDIKIEKGGGKFNALFSSVDVKTAFAMINWDKMWGFVIKKTIPIFWIPAHTVTFLLPSVFRILFAAVLSVILGIILAISDNK